MIIYSDKDGVLALTRKSFDNEIRTIYPIKKVIPENLPTYELMGHYKDSSFITSAYFRELTGRDDNFTFKTYLDEYCTLLKNIGIWRKFPYNGAILATIEKIRRNVTKRGELFKFNVITASGSEKKDRERIGNDTRLWLDQCGFENVNIIHETIKEKYLDCDIWIEDMPKYIIRILKAGFKGKIFLVDHTYNKDDTLRYSLSDEEMSRIRRIYPSLEIYRSHQPVNIDLDLTLNDSLYNNNLYNKIEKLLNKLDKKGVDIVKNPNYIPEFHGSNFVMALKSKEIDMITSLIGTEATTAILSRRILKILKKTSENAKTEIGEYFVNERIEKFKQGWPIYIHFEFKNNIHLYNYDSIKWFEYFYKKMKKYDFFCQCYDSEKIIIDYKNINRKKTDEFLSKTLYLKEINGNYKLELEFNDGVLKIDYSGEKLSTSYFGKRVGEIYSQIF